MKQLCKEITKTCAHAIFDIVFQCPNLLKKIVKKWGIDILEKKVSLSIKNINYLN